MLHQEMLTAALAQSRGQFGSEQRCFVLELFAGSTQLGQTVADMGLSYIAVDISNKSATCFQERHPAGRLHSI